MNIIQKTTDLAMYLVCAYVKPDSVVIDATCGNGNDTLALAAMGPAEVLVITRKK